MEYKFISFFISEIAIIGTIKRIDAIACQIINNGGRNVFGYQQYRSLIPDGCSCHCISDFTKKIYIHDLNSCIKNSVWIVLLLNDCFFR